MKIVMIMLLIFTLNISKADTIIITNMDNVKYIRKDILYDIYTLRKLKWDDGQPIIITLLPTSCLNTQEFFLNILQVPSLGKTLELINNRNLNIGNVVYKDKQIDVINYVINTRGSIGYVNDEIYIHDNVLSIVKIK